MLDRTRTMPAADRTLLAAVVAILALATSGRAQDLESVRADLSRSLRDTHFARGFTGLVVLSEELEISTGRLSFDDDEGTELSNVTLPFQTDIGLFGEEAPRLYLEGVLGYARAEQRVDDLHDGALPGFETSVRARWTTYGAHLGAGLRFDAAEGLTLTPIVSGALSRIESDARYGGPGADFSAGLLDGIGLNWEASTWTAGLALRADWVRSLGEDHVLEIVARHDVLWIGSFDEDADAQEFTDRAQFLTLRGDVVGPLGAEVLGCPLHWRGTLAWRHFFESSLLGTHDVVQLGASLELDVAGRLPLARRVTLDTALFVGDGMTGWSVGIGFSF